MKPSVKSTRSRLLSTTVLPLAVLAVGRWRQARAA